MGDLANGGIIPAGSRSWADADNSGCYIPRPLLTPCEITRRTIRNSALLAAIRIANHRNDNDEE